MSPAMEAYNEAFGTIAQVSAQEEHEAPSIEKLVAQAIQQAMEPVKEVLIALAKEVNEINQYLDQSHVWGNDVDHQLSALKQMVQNTQRNRLFFVHFLKQQQML